MTGVKTLPYKVTLSYPDKDSPNRIVLVDGSGDVVHTSQLAEKILSPDQNHSDVVPPFIAFSAPGTPKVRTITLSPPPEHPRYGLPPFLRPRNTQGTDYHPFFVPGTPKVHTITLSSPS